ncbi:hypothetical protein Gasu2_65180 [Galdieria sulphuraria]|nr:hypothetical protein Gasu2_65180 [Galdieria sulphuraria]
MRSVHSSRSRESKTPVIQKGVKWCASKDLFERNRSEHSHLKKDCTHERYDLFTKRTLLSSKLIFVYIYVVVFYTKISGCNKKGSQVFPFHRHQT